MPFKGRIIDDETPAESLCRSFRAFLPDYTGFLLALAVEQTNAGRKIVDVKSGHSNYDKWLKPKSIIQIYISEHFNYMMVYVL